jgi:DNA-binding winged helix-turn-helix (wHTH) protein
MLRPLPFVQFGPEGLVLHDTVREVVAALLRVNDPPAYRAHRIAAWRQLRRELRTAPPADLWRYTADLLYLIENPAVREAFFPTAGHRYAVEPARSADEAQITAIARAHQPAGAVNDFGPSSIDGWLTDLAAREMLIDDDVLLDPDRRQLIIDGTRADLTKLEFDVLQYLYEREGRVVGRAALLRDVWGYDWSGGSNVVEVVISALRRKLGDSAGNLQTVRGAGYRFTAPP